MSGYLSEQRADKRTRGARWRAPGRVNLIGEHTDYNDGFVLPFAIARGCTATVRLAGDGWTAVSAQQDEPVEVPVSGLGDRPEVAGWASYVLGACWLLTDLGYDVPPLRIEIDSDVPLGSGLSSSAALVCSVTTALDDLLGFELDSDGLLSLSRAVENDVVGAPTGGMDQLVSLRASAGHALFCDMRELTTEQVALDLGGSGLSLLVVDTRAPHRHSDGEYAERRRVCEDAAGALGVSALRDIALDDLDDALKRLPQEQAPYVRHVVTENSRVLDAVAMLRDGDVAGIGPLLTASHASMRDDFRITVDEVDTAVEALLSAGAVGARMTGGGFGGCVLGLLPTGSEPAAISAVEAAYDDRGFRAPAHFTAVPEQGAHPV